MNTNDDKTRISYCSRLSSNDERCARDAGVGGWNTVFTRCVVVCTTYDDVLSERVCWLGLCVGRDDLHVEHTHSSYLPPAWICMHAEETAKYRARATWRTKWGVRGRRKGVLGLVGWLGLQRRALGGNLCKYSMCCVWTTRRRVRWIWYAHVAHCNPREMMGLCVYFAHLVLSAKQLMLSWTGLQRTSQLNTLVWYTICVCCSAKHLCWMHTFSISTNCRAARQIEFARRLPRPQIAIH